jgi:hypothetical protein
MADKYWASKPTSEIADEIKTKFQDYKTWMSNSGYASKIQQSYDAYYGFSSDGSRGIVTYDDGKSKIQVNHYKNLIQRIHQLCTQAKLSWQTRARNSDSRSQIQSDFAKGLLEFYQDEKSLDKSLRSAVEMCLVMFEAFIYLQWDPTKGESIRPDENGNILKQGDQDIQILTPFSVARPTHKTTTPWYILELVGNKYDLAALYPQFATEILNAPAPETHQVDNDHLYSPYNHSLSTTQDEDVISYFVLYHPKSPALPQGRETLIIGDAVVYDKPLTYQKVPVVRMSAGETLNEVVGDSPASSLLSLQEGLDRLFSAVLTNNLNGAVQNIYSPDTNLSVRKLNEGQNLITATQPPVAVSLVGSSPETYKLIDQMIGQQQLLSGVNSTARGVPESNAKTAGGQSLMVAMAIQSISDLQNSYSRAAGEVGTIIINNLQSFCSEPKLAYIGGDSRKSYVKQFTNQDIAEVDRVSVDLGNPIMQTVGGRFDLVQEWTKMGLIKDPSKIVGFLQSGNIDSLNEDQFKDSMLIRSENEMLKKGELPVVLVTDMHPQHILEHKQVLSDPTARLDPTVTNAVTEHLMQHIDAYKNISPDLAAILGLQPLPSMQQPPAPEAPNPEVAGQNIPDVPNGTPPEIEEGFETNMQQLPQQ